MKFNSFVNILPSVKILTKQMDIIFKFGSFYGDDSSIFDDLIVQSLGAFIGFIGALIIFYIGASIEKRKEANKKKVIEAEKLKYLSFLIKDSLPVIRTTIDATQYIYSNISKNPFDLTPAPKLAHHSLTRIVEKINQEEYYHAYSTHLKSSNLSDIFVRLDFFHDLIIDIYKTIENLIKLDIERKVIFSQSIEDLAIGIREYLRKLKIDGNSQEDHYKFFNDLLMSYTTIITSSTSNDLLAFRHKFLSPLIVEFIKPLYIENNEIQKIVSKGSDTNKLLHPIIQTNKDNSLELKQAGERLEVELNKFKEIIIPLFDYTSTSLN